MILLFVWANPAQAIISLPSGMSNDEQKSMLQTLAFGTSFRPVNNPYPLGGYSGLELAISGQTIPTADISYYGNHTDQQSTLTYPLISIGKGVFDNTDIFFSFIPYDQATGMGIYSGGLRWTFFQATFVPASFSFLAHASNVNIENNFIAQTEGTDIIMGVNVDPFAFYFGTGVLYGQAQFSPNLTFDSTRSNQVGTTFHSIIGINVSISSFFTAFEVDSYSKIMLALKCGARF